MKKFAISISIKYCWMFTILSIALNPGLAFAQNRNIETKNEEFSLEVRDLIVPNAPASAIIDSQISLKPAVTPKAFGFSILNSLANGEGEFPNNIAVEFTPYWWSPRPELTFEKYYNNSGLGKFIFPSLSFSIASEASTITMDDDNEIDVTKLGLGLRFALIAGKANPQVEEAKNKLVEELNNCLDRIENETKKGKALKHILIDNREELAEENFSGLLETIGIFQESYNFEGEKAVLFDNLIRKIELLRDNQIYDKKKLIEILKEISQAIYVDSDRVGNIITEISVRAGIKKNELCLLERNAKIGELNTELKNLDKARVGLQLESASAVGFDFRENDFDEFRFRNVATWLTASYRSTVSGEAKKASPIEFLGVARYTFDELEDDTDSLFDLGAGLVYRLPTTPLTFSLEYVQRFGDDDDYRLVTVADYRINNTYSVLLSYGKDFEADFNGNDDVVTLFGLKVGLGRNPVVTEKIKQPRMQ